MENWLTYELLVIQMLEEREQQARRYRALEGGRDATRPSAVRAVIGGALVRIGLLFDDAAAERALNARGVALEGERR